MMLTFTILGGLALFLFGMQLMTEGLRAAAGERLRAIVYRGTANRLAGLGMGTGLGFLMHSSATSVMVVGFLNAGLVGLVHSIPVFMGANIGTTLSMQLISFRLTDYALMAVALGFLLGALGPSPLMRNLGRSLLGFGLLFNGMDLMSGAIEPHREALLPWLEYFDGTTWGGMLLGTLFAGAFTAIVQSSGATIGMTFVLISAGVFTSLEQVYPIILGAHLGTPVTAIIASLGCGVESRRGAAANFLFSIFNVALGVVAAPLFIGAMEATSGDVVRQAANLHTAIMVVAAVPLLPFTARLAGLVRILLPSKAAPAQLSFLDPELLTRPENALTAVIRESRRSLGIVARSLREIQLLARDTRRWRDSGLVRTNEAAVNEIREATRAYLAELTGRYLSRRQRLLAQSLAKIARHVERIGDYVVHIHTSIEYQRRTPAAAPDDSIHAAFMELFARTEAVLAATRRSLDPDAGRFAADAAAIIEACDQFSARADAVRQAVDDRVAEHDLAAIAGLHFSTLLSWFDALVRHCAMIAREEEHAFFHIKAAKLDRIEPPAMLKPGPRRTKRGAGDCPDERPRDTPDDGPNMGTH